MKKRTIDSFFIKNNSSPSVERSPIIESIVGGNTPPSLTPNIEQPDIDSIDQCASKIARVESSDCDELPYKVDPGLRTPLWKYNADEQEEVRRFYVGRGPYQLVPNKTPVDKNGRHFRKEWIDLFKDWLEYSPQRNLAFCFPCYLFTSANLKERAFTVDGFNTWNKVTGKKCALVKHVGASNSIHNFAVEKLHKFKNSSKHIDIQLQNQSSEQIARNRFKLQVSIDTVKWLSFQACAFRGHNERHDSENRGNFLELMNFLGRYNTDVEALVKSPHGNASYTSPLIQKEILSIIAKKVRYYIREEIGDNKYCIIIDESRDESKKEQMAIVLRFVDTGGFVRERFLDLVHVPDTKSLSLKSHICQTLSFHKLDIKNLRGQGYDGASNMRGEWNGLQALILKECPFAYYVHCFAHRLQLALVAAASDVISVSQFFENVTSIVNVVTSSTKRHDQLLSAQVDLICELISVGELETGKGKNQVGTLKRHGDTRWSSHLNSLHSLIKMYDATCLVLRDIINDRSCISRQRSEADGVYDKITSFEFIFILHMMVETLEITDDLCQALQRKSQDIENAMNLVSSTKIQLQELREEGWVTLLEKVKLFCDKREIEIPDMQMMYKSGRGRGRTSDISVEHHLRVDLFNSSIDFQFQELQSRFGEDVSELLMLTSALNPRDRFTLFNVDDICKLASKFYPSDFTEFEMSHLKYQLNNFKIDARTSSELEKVSTISELCRVLQETKKCEIYPLFDRLIRLVLTLPVSTATTERAFSAMKIVKTRLRNKMADDFLADNLVTYIEKEIARGFEVDSIIDAFDLKKKRRVPLQMSNKTK